MIPMPRLYTLPTGPTVNTPPGKRSNTGGAWAFLRRARARSSTSSVEVPAGTGVGPVDSPLRGLHHGTNVSSHVHLEAGG